MSTPARHYPARHLDLAGMGHHPAPYAMPPNGERPAAGLRPTLHSAPPGSSPSAPAPAGDALADYRIAREPYYRQVSDEIELFEAAYAVRMPVMIKGPTGCGKTRFIEHMAWRLGKPLVTVACHEDLTPPTWSGASCSTPRARAGKTARWRWRRGWAPFATSTKWWKRARTPPSSSTP